jgi:hypothetical protein
VWARNSGDRPAEQISVQLCIPSTMGEDYAFCQGVITVDSPQWKKYELVLTSPLTAENGTTDICSAVFAFSVTKSVTKTSRK